LETKRDIMFKIKRRKGEERWEDSTWTIHEGKAMPTWISECIIKKCKEISYGTKM